MKRLVCIVFILVQACVFAQTLPLPGSKAPDFIIHRDAGSIESVLFPYLKKMVYLHFWNNDIITSRQKCGQLNHFAKRYKNAIYRNAEGFEVIAIALTNRVMNWKQTIKEDSLTNISHCIALKEYDDDVCKKYGVTNLPTGVLIDENGVVMAVDPTMVQLETILDEQRNMQPARKDITGIMAYASNKNDVMKYCRIYLFNHYGDSLSKTVTSNTGNFIFGDIKINQDFILKVDNQSDIVTTDPATIYSVRGEQVLEGKTREGGFVFYIPPALGNKLIQRDTAMHSEIQMDVIKSMKFENEDSKLTAKDEEELALIVHNLQKSKLLKIELTAHADTRVDAVLAMEQTAKQAGALRSYLEKKGISPSRITVIARGNTEPRKRCGGEIVCSEADHLSNRRVEIQVYKD